MELVKIWEKSINLQKRHYNNIFGTLVLFQEGTERTIDYWLYRMNFNKSDRNVVKEYWKTMMKNQCDNKNLINEGYKILETYFSG